ncbi:MAG: cupredoxin domain-containing protein [Rhizobacter sp.]|nr:cupredoxin domain-containing protein [Bacteriovorax sp.]
MKLLISLALLSNVAFADDLKIIELHIKNHKYDLEKIEVEANKKFKLKIYNDDSSSEEFESKSMVVEKFIGPKKSITITIGPLKPGSYDYFADFHPSTGKGILIAK